MTGRKLLATWLLLSGMAVPTLTADEVRYFEKDGITYKETRQVVRRAIPETRWEQRECTVFRENYTTDMQPIKRHYQTPVTEYQWVPVWERGWNPFAAPVLTYKYLPQTRWETRSETVRIPVTRRELVPVKRQEQIPVTTQRIAEDEIVTRTAIGPSNKPDPFAQAPAVANRETVGGVSELENDPPRQGANWHAADSTIRR